ncbi:hypothetical protein ESP57_06410 [Agromyces fucosus]|uniref:Uncharacterized protein n=1 Tax=Agromyces fucosus TaxID=41985 RepID=A0A4Q2JPK7_9MICO|nr:hypothetical protein ESP57_06410 [Agromyces fucosus]
MDRRRHARRRGAHVRRMGRRGAARRPLGGLDRADSRADGRLDRGPVGLGNRRLSVRLEMAADDVGRSRSRLRESTLRSIRGEHAAQEEHE